MTFVTRIPVAQHTAALIYCAESVLKVISESVSLTLKNLCLLSAFCMASFDYCFV